MNQITYFLDQQTMRELANLIQLYKSPRLWWWDRWAIAKTIIVKLSFRLEVNIEQ